MHSLWPQWNVVKPKEIPEKYTNSWILNHFVFKWAIEETNKEVLKFLELNENENASHQNLWDSMKAVLRGKSIVLSAYIQNN